MAVKGDSTHKVLSEQVETLFRASAPTRINSIILHNSHTGSCNFKIYIVKAGGINGTANRFYDINLPAGGTATIEDPINLAVNDVINARTDMNNAINALVNYTEVS